MLCALSREVDSRAVPFDTTSLSFVHCRGPLSVNGPSEWMVLWLLHWDIIAYVIDDPSDAMMQNPELSRAAEVPAKTYIQYPRC